MSLTLLHFSYACTEKFTVGRANFSLVETWLSLLTIIMSSERPSETNRVRKIAGSVKGKLSSLLHLPRAPNSAVDRMRSSSDNATLARWATWVLFSNIILKRFRTFKIFATQCHPCRSCTYHTVCCGSLQIVWAPNFSARTPAYFCYWARIGNPIHGWWLCCAHDFHH